jgi:hypothetical protein
MKFFRRTRRIASSLVLGLFLALYVLTAVPALHALVHSDAGESEHQCAVTLFSHGQVDISNTVISMPSVPSELIFSTASPRFIFVSVDLRLLPSRGPPAFFGLA